MTSHDHQIENQTWFHRPPATSRMRKAAEVVPVSAIMTTKSNNLGAKPRVSRVGPGGGDQGYQRLTTPDPHSETSTVLPSLGLTTKIRLYLVWAVLSATRCPGRRGQVSRRSRLPLNENGIGDQKIESIGREVCSV